MKSALILVDIQNDFMPGGSLAVSDGDKVVAVANTLMAKVDLVVATQDFHPANHSSFASNNDGSVGDVVKLNGLDQILWPDHCVQGTGGAELVDDLDGAEIDVIVQKGTDVGIDSYSGFFDNGRKKATELDDVLKKHNIDAVYIVGLATDYCVKYTALDAVSLGFETFLVKDGARGVNISEGDVDIAIFEMEKAGVNVITSDAVT